MQALKAKADNCQVSFTQIEHCCGSIRVTGWISAPSRDEGFAFCGKLAQKLNRPYLGGFCLEDNSPVNFPFQYDEEFVFDLRRCTKETKDDALARVQAQVRKMCWRLNRE
jgi:hypothetical protein